MDPCFQPGYPTLLLEGGTNVFINYSIWKNVETSVAEGLQHNHFIFILSLALKFIVTLHNRNKKANIKFLARQTVHN
ncbi:hypothetical protein FisN_29Hu015 [Fistulifera solaris]|jgi:hypothetical protein|uniref:Uncharacterized protein n=1 Tax=Fistulifera solaris TaxID=1519565 RepID=A0A1Z5K5M2_FISSO|nr:hypothetical protein FisN_29Hu015 [Fistulifera solaris]|eukprot:GAX21583.1 hypothetical protein FisN_29Hu015 [Fistulifera solaris]